MSNKKTPIKIEKQCKKIYEKSGLSGVLDYCNSIGHKEWDYCHPCDSLNPVSNGICLVCGSTIKKR